jgi:hypothetical protein
MIQFQMPVTISQVVDGWRIQFHGLPDRPPGEMTFYGEPETDGPWANEQQRRAFVAKIGAEWVEGRNEAFLPK